MQQDGRYVRERAQKKGDESDSGCEERGEDLRCGACRSEKLKWRGSRALCVSRVSHHCEVLIRPGDQKEDNESRRGL